MVIPINAPDRFTKKTIKRLLGSPYENSTISPKISSIKRVTHAQQPLYQPRASSNYAWKSFKKYTRYNGQSSSSGIRLNATNTRRYPLDWFRLPWFPPQLSLKRQSGNLPFYISKYFTIYSPHTNKKGPIQRSGLLSAKSLMILLNR